MVQLAPAFVRSGASFETSRYGATPRNDAGLHGTVLLPVIHLSCKGNCANRRFAPSQFILS